MGELVAACGLADPAQATLQARILLDGGASITETDASGATALHLACQAGHVRLAVLLMQRGAVLDACDQMGRSPML